LTDLDRLIIGFVLGLIPVVLTGIVLLWKYFNGKSLKYLLNIDDDELYG